MAAIAATKPTLRLYGTIPSEQELAIEARLAANTNTPHLRAHKIMDTLAKSGMMITNHLTFSQVSDANKSAHDSHQMLLSALERVHHPAYVRFVLGAWADYNAHRQTDAAGMVAHVDISNDTLVPFVIQQPSDDAELERKVACLPLRKQLTLFASDQMTPIAATTGASALESARATWTAAHELLSLVHEPGALSYCPNKSPGHHTAPRQYGGYCMLNNGALAASVLSQGGKNKVLLLDVDFHAHVSRMFGDDSTIRMVSLHHDPTDEFPYASGFVADNSGSTFNCPLASGTPWEQYSAKLAEVLDIHVRQWQPDYLVIAFGGDTFKGDPDVYPQTNRFLLDVDDYAAMGKQIAAAFKGHKLVTQEGGYCIEAIGDIVTGFLGGLLVVVEGVETHQVHQTESDKACLLAANTAAAAASGHDAPNGRTLREIEERCEQVGELLESMTLSGHVLLSVVPSVQNYKLQVLAPNGMVRPFSLERGYYRSSEAHEVVDLPQVVAALMSRFGSKKSDDRTRLQEAMMVLRNALDLVPIPDDKVIRIVAPSGEKMAFHADDLCGFQERAKMFYVNDERITDGHLLWLRSMLQSQRSALSIPAAVADAQCTIGCRWDALEALQSLMNELATETKNHAQREGEGVSNAFRHAQKTLGRYMSELLTEADTTNTVEHARAIIARIIQRAQDEDTEALHDAIAQSR